VLKEASNEHPITGRQKQKYAYIEACREQRSKANYPESETNRVYRHSGTEKVIDEMKEQSF